MLLLFDGFYYIDTLQSELSTAKTYELISTDETSVINKHCSDIETKFAVGITESQAKTSNILLDTKTSQTTLQSLFHRKL